MKHTIKASLLTKTVEIALVGCGGNGSLMLTELTKIDKAIRELGHPYGFHVTVFDPDTVSESNLGRQNFYSADKGQFKAICLVNRVNMCCGVQWKAEPVCFPPNGYYRPDIIISCVDTKTARRGIAEYARAQRTAYWLDMGNKLSDGQVILGEPKWASEKAKDRPLRLPTITDLFPEVLDDLIPEDESTPTCSLAEALAAQDLFICRSVATFAAQLLWTLFRKGGVDNHGYFINLEAGMVLPLAVDPAAWERFKPAKPRRKGSGRSKSKV